MKEKVRAAVVQSASVVFDREATLEKVGVLAGEAAAKGAELVVFPEAFISGYPKGMSFGAVVGWRTEGPTPLFKRTVKPFGLPLMPMTRSSRAS